jgi:ABC-type glycerol-3-phosphate transport system permease component
MKAGSNLKASRVLPEIVLLVAMVLTLLPIVWVLVNSFKYVRDIINPGSWSAFTLLNYRGLFSGTSEFTRLFLNSLVLVFFATILCLAIGLLAAYSLSKFRWPWAFTAAVLGAILFIQLVPPVALVPAYYVILNNFYLYDSVTGLVLVNTALNLPFAVLLLKVYFDSIPDELRQAALVDGCKDFTAFRKIMVPLAAPGIAAVTILVAILTWNEFLMALSLTSTPNAQTITVGIGSYVQEYSVRYGDMTAAASIASIPLIVLAVFAHRYLVAGLTGGAIKG